MATGDRFGNTVHLMDFTPHTTADEVRLLNAVGLVEPSDLFSHLPSAVRVTGDLDLPAPLSEPQVMELIGGLGDKNAGGLVCFAGGGVYDHFLPPVVRALTMRPEFVTAYTPYQPEVSQGVLQALFEYQSMICAITGLPVANASIYDGATSAMEALNLAVAATKRDAVWISRGLPPNTKAVLATFAAARGIEIVEHPMVGGRTAWAADAGPAPAAVFVAQPNYLGVIEDYAEAATAATGAGALLVAQVDPMTLGVLRTPGAAGADIAVAEGQGLGNPMSFGGPLLGIFATTTEQMRRLPGRLVGKTVDTQDRTAYVMTLRTREQDIRREKASSNICTNQTLNALAAATYMAWVGPAGLATVGQHSAQKAHYLADRLSQLPGVSLANESAFLREFAVLLPMDPSAVLLAMAERGFLAGIALSGDFPELPGGLLVATTEQRSKEQLDAYVAALAEVLADG
jgi:glycine dehydrogenase subunit 1